MSLAPDSKNGWVIFTSAMMVLYTLILILNTESSLQNSLLLGAFYGMIMSAIVILLVLVFRAILRFSQGTDQDSV